MSKVKRYSDMNIDLKTLYKEIVKELYSDTRLNVVEEKNGELNGATFMSVTATSSSIPKTLKGSLRELTVTITGNKDDFLIELHIGARFSNIETLDNTSSQSEDSAILIVSGGTPELLATDYDMKLKNKIEELVCTQHERLYSGGGRVL